jgi:hypothetical protein
MRTRSAALAVAIMTLGGWLAPRLAAACSCIPEPNKYEPQVIRAEADLAHAVFEGKVRSVTEQGQERVAVLDVRRFWRGEPGARVEVRTSLSGAACGVGFTPRVTYLVFAHKNDAGQLTAYACSYNTPLREAGRVVQALGPGERPPRIEGRGCILAAEPGAPLALLLLLGRRRRTGQPGAGKH